jgi:putative DNA primase/helicase
MDNDKERKDIRAAVEKRRKAEALTLKVDNHKSEFPPTFVHDCLMANERGDGALFAALHKGEFLFNTTSNHWLRWAGHHWDFDEKEEAHRSVEQVALSYLDEGFKLSKAIAAATKKDEKDRAGQLAEKQKSYSRRASRLRSVKGVGNCLTMAHREEGFGVRGEEFDRSNWLLACRNGVIELDIGRFRDGRPDDYLTKAVPHEWPKDKGGIDCPAPTWEKFLENVFAGDADLIAYVRRLFGYGITGLTREHIFPVLHGAGRNGKGTLVEMLRYVAGSVAQPIQSEMLLDQRTARSSAGPSPDIMTLKGLRIAFASEIDENRRFSPGKVKWLTGGDTLTGRNPHDRYETTFEPTHLLCLLTNHLPHAPGDDFAFWQRLHLVPFNIQFVDRPSGENERTRDKELPEKLKAEAPGILAWLVRGCIEWQQQGLNPPQVVLSATEQYRFSEDLLSEFIEACCYPPKETSADARIKFSEIYDEFKNWYCKTVGDEKYCPKKKKFSALMEKRFKKVKASGYVWFYGLSLKAGFDRED